MELNRRHLLGLSAGALAASALTACSTTASPPTAASSASVISEDERTKALNTPTELTFWTWVPNIDTKEVAAFMKAYPNIKVKVENVGQGAAHYQKLRTALKAGEGGPDVAQMEFQYIPSYVVTKSLLDLTPYGAASLQPLFVDWCWKQVVMANGIYAIPQDSGPLGNVYRKDILDSAGITTPPVTWDDYYTAAKAVRTKTKSYISDFASGQGGMFVALLWQAGAKPFTWDGGEKVGINLSSPEATKVMQYWQKLIQEDLVSTDADFNDAWYQGLANGKYAGWITAAWGPVFLQGTAAKTTGLWRASKAPQWSSTANAAGNWGGSTSALIKGTKNPIAAYELAKYINSNAATALQFANEQFFFPVTKSTITDPKWSTQTSDFFGGQKVNELFGGIADTVDPNFQWLPFMEYVYSSAQDTMTPAITNKGDLVVAMKAWETALKTYATQQGFTLV